MPQETHHFQATVSDAHSGLRLDQVAHMLWPEFSRGRLQSWIKDGHLQLGGQSVLPKTKVKGGDQVTLLAVMTPQGPWQAEPLPLDVVFEDEHVLVINKPDGLVVHPAPGHSDGTLVNALLHHSPELANLPRAGIIHRIDKDTTGLLVVAKTLVAHAQLVDAMQLRQIKRQYLALVWGQITGSGTVDKPIGRHPRYRTRMAVVGSGKPAVTHYTIERRFAAHTLLRVTLETGRTHQIRVHLSQLGHAIVGDQLYGGRQRTLAGVSTSKRAQFDAFKRQALHAAELSFLHPVYGTSITLSCDLPDDFQALLALLASGA